MTATNRYLPAGSRIAVKNPQGVTTWYTTREDVPVPSGDLVTTSCPMRTGVAVNTIDYKGCSLYFLPAQVRTRLDAEQLKTARNLNLYKLEYDIPEILPEGYEGFQAPHTYLGAYAVRSTKSCWVVPKGNIPALMTRLNQLTEVGSTWNIEKIDPSEIENNINRVITSVQKEVNRLIKSSEGAEQRAGEELDATPASADPNKALKKYRTRASTTLKKNQKILAELESVCKTFGIPGTSDWAKARASIKLVENAIQTRARLVTEAVETLREAGGESAQVAAALESGSMDPEIAADYLQDQGKDEQAEVLRSAFAGAVADSDTFSLDDAEGP